MASQYSESDRECHYRKSLPTNKDAFSGTTGLIQGELFHFIKQGFLNDHCERSDSRRLKQFPQWRLDLKGVAHARYDLCGEQGVPAKIEEVVVDAEPVDLEQLAPNARERALDARPRPNDSDTTRKVLAFRRGL
jgi:hypothetical protein